MEGVDKNQSKKLTRRDFLKLCGLGGAALLLKSLHDMYKNVFRDASTAFGCLTNEYENFINVQNEKLKGSYDKALIVVHPGYAILRKPEKFTNNEAYNRYLKNLRETIETAKENDELVVFLVGAENYRTGRFIEGLRPNNADFVEITESENPMVMACVQASDGKFYYQSPDVLFVTLKKYGVKTISFAGEFRNACVAFTKNAFNSGYKTNLLEKSIFPPDENK